jgi:hypothetical protein
MLAILNNFSSLKCNKLKISQIFIKIFFVYFKTFQVIFFFNLRFFKQNIKLKEKNRQKKIDQKYFK